MSNPTNSAARNTMSEFERQCYDWGWEDAEQRIIKLLEPHRMTPKSVGGFLGVCTCGSAMDDYQEHLLELIKGENK